MEKKHLKKILFETTNQENLSGVYPPYLPSVRSETWTPQSSSAGCSATGANPRDPRRPRPHPRWFDIPEKTQ